MPSDPITNLPADAVELTGAIAEWMIPGAFLVAAAVLGGFLLVWAIKELT